MYGRIIIRPYYPCRCLWRIFLQIIRTTPLRLITLQCRHTFLTDARTFIIKSKICYLNNAPPFSRVFFIIDSY